MVRRRSSWFEGDTFTQAFVFDWRKIEVDKFDISEDEQYAIDISCNVIRSLLRNPRIKPQQIIGLGNALYALERMPNVTEGVYCEYGIVYRAGTEEFNEMRYITFLITDYLFSISKGGSVYESLVGGDSFSEPDWIIELGGYRDTEMDLFDIEDSIQEYLNLGAEITVEDESDINFEQDE